MVLESDIVRRIIATLNAIDGVYCLRTHGGSFQQRGTPDVLGCARGRFFAIEVKRSAKAKPKPEQLYNLSKFKKAKGVTFVSHDPEVKDIVAWIHSLPK